jgi:hypothetical protein
VVRAGRWLYVLADDELAIARFAAGDLESPGVLIDVFDGELPLDHAERKAAKPDLEALALLPDGSLLALGSGATPQRERGALLALDTGGEPIGAPRVLDLGGLYASLRAAFGTALNLEGAAVAGGRLHLANRASGVRGGDAVATLDLDAALGSAPVIDDVRRYDLGERGGVALSLTDLAPDPAGGLLFTAAAEDTASSYLDGEVAGSAIGRIDPGGALVDVTPLDTDAKVEGIWPDGEGAWLVADADDPAVAAPLLRITAR